MSDEDLASIVVYLRSLRPVQNPLPKTEIVFPVKYLIRSAPQPVTSPVPAGDLHRSGQARRVSGRDLGLLRLSHAAAAQGQPVSGLAFAGGFELKGPFGTVTSANITPDPSGISYYDENLFIQVMRTGKVGARTLNPIMPWIALPEYDRR